MAKCNAWSLANETYLGLTDADYANNAYHEDM
jgi:outer membrane receptor for Fe3+-dicitrate